MIVKVRQSKRIIEDNDEIVLFPPLLKRENKLFIWKKKKQLNFLTIFYFSHKNGIINTLRILVN